MNLFSGNCRGRHSVLRALPAILLLLVPGLLPAQVHECSGADAVVSLTLGQGGGRGKDYLPGSVLGLPDTVGRLSTPTIAPEEVLSLGLEGEIVLGFNDVLIVDGPGVDFTVFENAFAYRMNSVDRIYAEPAEVAVSRDGVEFYTFEWNPETLEGCAGVGPTIGDQSPCDPAVSGGDSFDLSVLGVDSIRFIRLRDVTRTVLEDKDHAFYDATLNGFDLDAVVGVNTVSQQASSVRTVADQKSSGIRLELVPGLSGEFVLELPRAGTVHVQVYDLNGNRVVGPSFLEGVRGSNAGRISLEGLSSGAYLVAVTVDGIGTVTEQIRILR